MRRPRRVKTVPGTVKTVPETVVDFTLLCDEPTSPGVFVCVAAYRELWEQGAFISQLLSKLIL